LASAWIAAWFAEIVRVTGDTGITEHHGSALIVFVFEPSQLPTPLFFPSLKQALLRARTLAR
jgi:hypothetical protein